MKKFLHRLFNAPSILDSFRDIVPTVSHITALVCKNEPDRIEKILEAKTSPEFAEAIGVPRDIIIKDTIPLLEKRYAKTRAL